MRYRLRDHLACCRCGDTLVLLDLAADRYFQMTGPSAVALSDILAHGANADHRDRLDHFLRTGLLVADGGGDGNARSAAIAIPTRDVLSQKMPPFALWRTVQAVVMQRRAERALSRRPLLDIVTRLAARSRPDAGTAAPGALARARPIAAAFVRSGYVIPVADACLARSLALIWACHRAHIHPRLVFGVSLAPFAAHAWAQLGDWVLTGDLDQVRRYTPILVVP